MTAIGTNVASANASKLQIEKYQKKINVSKVNNKF